MNYGHTLGHAIESYCLTHESKEKLLHGEAIAIGMILETFISAESKDFPREKSNNITGALKNIYGEHTFNETDIDKIQELMKYDKKNAHGKINFVLLQDIGKPLIDCNVEPELIKKAFDHYLNY